MYKVIFDKPCSCLLKSGLDEDKEFISLKEANDYAHEVSRFANSSFCKTHFYMPQDEQENEILVKVRLRRKK